MANKRIRKNQYRQRTPSWRKRCRQTLSTLFKLTAYAGLLALISFVLIFSHDVLTQCDYFQTDAILVNGQQRLSAEEILRQAQLQQGTNSLAVNLALTRKRLLAHPWIADAQVGRELPNRLLIQIREHQPLAILDVGRKFLLNREGQIFKAWQATDPDDLAIIQGLELSDLNTPGHARSRPFQAVMDVLMLAQAPDNAGSTGLFSQIHVDREIGLTLLGHSQVRIIQIGYQNFQNKYDRLKHVLAHIRRQKRFIQVESIDLKNLDRIVVKPAQTKSTAQHHKEA